MIKWIISLFKKKEKKNEYAYMDEWQMEKEMKELMYGDFHYDCGDR